MRPVTFPIKCLLLASVCALAPNCTGPDKPRPTVALSPPADLLDRAPEPAMPVEALTSEEAYEQARDRKVEWGRANAAVIDRACAWLKAAGVALDCGAR